MKKILIVTAVFMLVSSGLEIKAMKGLRKVGTPEAVEIKTVAPASQEKQVVPANPITAAKVNLPNEATIKSYITATIQSKTNDEALKYVRNLRQFVEDEQKKQEVAFSGELPLLDRKMTINEKNDIKTKAVAEGNLEKALSVLDNFWKKNTEIMAEDIIALEADIRSEFEKKESAAQQLAPEKKQLGAAPKKPLPVANVGMLQKEFSGLESDANKAISNAEAAEKSPMRGLLKRNLINEANWQLTAVQEKLTHFEGKVAETKDETLSGKVSDLIIRVQSKSGELNKPSFF